MAEEIVIRVGKCEECPFGELLFSPVGLAVYCCELKEGVTWSLGNNIPPDCPFRKPSKKRNKRSYKQAALKEAS